MSWTMQSADENSIELVWDKLDQKEIAQQLTVLLTSGNSCRKAGAELSSVYLQSLVERMPRICEAVIAAKGGHFDESKV